MPGGVPALLRVPPVPNLEPIGPTSDTAVIFEELLQLGFFDVTVVDSSGSGEPIVATIDAGGISNDGIREATFMYKHPYDRGREGENCFQSNTGSGK